MNLREASGGALSTTQLESQNYYAARIPPVPTLPRFLGNLGELLEDSPGEDLDDTDGDD